MNSRQFSLIMLGTDTKIEGIKDGNYVRLLGYERGETLNAIYQVIDGIPLQDKHIVSGPTTLGTEFDQRVAEGLLFILKAITEDKRDIRVAAHSRGAVETIIIMHKVQEVMQFAATNPTPENFKKKIIEIIKRPADKGNLSVDCINDISADDLLHFQSVMHQSTDIDVKGFKSKSTNLSFSVSILLNAFKNKVNYELFLIDPVPGQKNLVQGWRVKEFYTIPAIVQRATVIYYRNEKSKYFEPNFLRVESLLTILNVISMVGSHGLGSGWLDKQGQINTGYIGKDEDEKHGIRGLKTRHVQKYMAGKLVVFFDMKSSAIDFKIIKGKRVAIPSIIKTIISCIAKFNNEVDKNNFFLKRYDKATQELAEIEKFNHTAYSDYLKYLPNEPRVLYVDIDGPVVKMSELRELYVPPRGYINNEHIMLDLNGKFKHLLSQQGGYEYIYNMLVLYKNCFQDATGKHKDQAGCEQTNQSIIDYFCKDEHAAHQAAGYFYLLVEPFLTNNFINILSDGNNVSAHQQSKKINELITALLQAIESYAGNNGQSHSPTPKEKKDLRNLRDKAKSLHIELVRARDTVMENLTAQTKAKIDGLYAEWFNFENEYLLPGNEKIVAIHRLKESIENLMAKLPVVRDAQLIKESDYESIVGQLRRLSRLAQRSEQQCQLLIMDADFQALDNKLKSLNNESQLKIANFSGKSGKYKRVKKYYDSFLQGMEKEADETLAELNDVNWVAMVEHKKVKKEAKECLSTLQDRYEKLSRRVSKYLNAIPESIALFSSLEEDDLIYKSLANLLTKAQCLADHLEQAKNDIRQQLREKVEEECREIDLLNDQLVSMKNSCKESSYQEQFNNLEEIINKLPPESERLALLQVIKTEIAMTHEQQAKPEAVLCKTLRIVNRYAESSPNDEVQRALFSEASNYLNERSPQLKTIGYCMLGLALVGLVATIALTVLTCGVGLLPAIAAYGTIFTGITTVTGVSVGAYSLFAAKQPRLYTALGELESRSAVLIP